MSARGAIAAITTAFLLIAAAAAIRRAASHRASSALRRRLAPNPGGRAFTPAPTAGVTEAPPWFARRMQPLDLGIAPAVLWRRWLMILVIGAPATTLLGQPLITVTVLAASIAAPVAVPWALRGRRARRIDAQLPTLLDAIGSGLRAGDSLHQAVLDAATTAASPLGRELRPVVLAARGGSSLADELDRWSERSASRAVGMTVAALSLGLRDGGPQAHAIDGVAATMRDRLAVSSEIRALSSQARASAAVIVVAPVVFAVVSATVERGVLEFLVATPAGIACLAVGIGLDAAGAVWMAGIMRSAS